MRFKYENLFYKITFDGSILSYSSKRLLRWFLLRPFEPCWAEFPVNEISTCKTSAVSSKLNCYQFELASWNTSSGQAKYRKLPGIYLRNDDVSAIADLSKIIDYETRMDKKQQNWFIPRYYSRMTG